MSSATVAASYASLRAASRFARQVAEAISRIINNRAAAKAYRATPRKKYCQLAYLSLWSMAGRCTDKRGSIIPLSLFATRVPSVINEHRVE